MADVYEWPELPEGATGQQVRYRHISHQPATSRPVRLGGLEPKAIVAETESWVIYRVWDRSGRDLGERCCPKPEFETEFERRADRG